MTGGRVRLARLLAIRKLSEEVDSGTLQMVLASVVEVEKALQRQKASILDARFSVGAALSTGDRGEWLMADAQSEVAGWNRQRLNVLLRTRTETLALAMQKFIESRREHEQVKQLVDDAKKDAIIDQYRKAQSAIDDWFLSKRARGLREVAEYSILRDPEASSH